MRLIKSLFPPREDQATSNDYELKIDDQVIKFLDLKHKLTFFMITAAVGTLAFTINLSVSNSLVNVSNLVGFSLLIFASLTALLSASYSLVALNADINSFRLHLKYRYMKKSYDELSIEIQENWDTINNKAARSRRWSFVLLISTVALQIIFLVFAFLEKGVI